MTSGARRAVSVEERLQVAFGGVDRDRQPFIFRPLEVIEPRPMTWQFDGLEDVQVDRRVRGREDECRVAEGSSPARFDQRAVDMAADPPPFERLQLMRVWATGCEASVGG